MLPHYLVQAVSGSVRWELFGYNLPIRHIYQTPFPSVRRLRGAVNQHRHVLVSHGVEILHTTVGGAFNLKVRHRTAPNLTFTSFFVVTRRRRNRHRPSYDFIMLHYFVATEKTVCPDDDAPFLFIQVGGVAKEIGS